MDSEESPTKTNTRNRKRLTKKVTKRRDRILKSQQDYLERIRNDPAKLESYRNRGKINSQRYRQNRRTDPAFKEKERQRRRALYWRKKKEELETTPLSTTVLKVHSGTVSFSKLESPVVAPVHVDVGRVKLAKLTTIPTTIREKLDRMRELETMLKDSLWLESNRDPLLRLDEIKDEPVDV